METDDLNPARNPPATASPIHQNEESRVCITTESEASVSFRDSVNHIGTMHNDNSARVDHNPILFGSLPIYPRPAGNMTGTYQPYVHGVTGNGDNVMSGATHFNTFQNPQIDSSVSIRDNSTVGFQTNSLGGTANGTNSFPYELQFDDIRRQQIHGNFLSVGGKTHLASHSYDRGESTIANNVMCNAVQSNSLNFPEHIDGNFLSLGFGGNTAAGYQSNVHGRGIYINNERPVATQSNNFHGSQSDGSFSSLCHNMGGGFPSPGPCMVGSFSSPGHNMGGRSGFPSPGHNLAGGFPSLGHNMGGSFPGLGHSMGGSFPSLGHNIGGWTRSNNDGGITCGTNAGPSSSPFNIFHTPQGDVQQYFPMPSNRILGVGGNRDARSTNIVPYRGYQGYPTVALGPPSIIQAGFLDNEEARLSRIESAYTTVTRTPNEPDYTQVQQGYLDTLRSFPIESSVISPIVGSIRSTSGRDQSGQPFPANDGTVAQSAESLGLADRRRWGRPASKSIHHISHQGHKPGLSQKSRLAQSGKDLLGPDVASGKPVPVAERSGLTQTSKFLRGPRVNRGGNQPTSYTPPTPRSFVGHIPSSNSTNPIHHLRWKGLDGPHSSVGQNCPLCKRDLSYTPTGPVSQPSIPPSVAILPCGHAFHDDCLLLITPKEQSKDPPCIPCSIDKF